jgi:hypothetical protein
VKIFNLILPNKALCFKCETHLFFACRFNNIIYTRNFGTNKGNTSLLLQTNNAFSVIFRTRPEQEVLIISGELGKTYRNALLRVAGTSLVLGVRIACLLLFGVCCKGKGIPLHTMKSYGCVGIQLQSFLTF